MKAQTLINLAALLVLYTLFATMAVSQHDEEEHAHPAEQH